MKPVRLGVIVFLAACEAPAAAPASGHELFVPEPDSPVAVDAARVVRVDTLSEVLSVSDAWRAPTVWVLLDGRSRQIHAVRDDGGVTTFAREGRGPGELLFPTAVAVTGGRVVVTDAAGHRVSFFSLDGDVLGQTPLGHPSCPFGTPDALVPGAGGRALVLLTCTGLEGSLHALVLEVEPGRPPREVASRPIQRVSERLDPMRGPVLATFGGAAYLGMVPEPCLNRIGPGDDVPSGAPPDPPDRICARRSDPVPLPDSARARLEALGADLRRRDVELLIPRWLPPFMGVASAPPRLAFRVPLRGGSGALDILEEDGGVTRLLPSARGRVFLGPDGILLVRDLLVGTELTRLVLR